MWSLSSVKMGSMAEVEGMLVCVGVRVAVSSGSIIIIIVEVRFICLSSLGNVRSVKKEFVACYETANL